MNESMMGRGPEDERLDGLLGAYRQACEPRQVSANFMPELWQKIERTQNAKFSFQRISKGFVTAAAALSLALAVIGFLPSSQSALSSGISYIEALADHTEALAAHNDTIEYIDFLHLDIPDDVEEI
jgi:hypothetical protein